MTRDEKEIILDYLRKNVKKIGKEKLKFNMFELRELILEQNEKDGTMHITVPNQILRILDLRNPEIFYGVDVCKVDFRGTNVNLDPQWVLGKNLYRTNLENIDMTGKKFDDVLIHGANLNYTHADLNPQTIKNKDMQDVKVIGLDFSDKDFSDVNVQNAVFYKAKEVVKSIKRSFE